MEQVVIFISNSFGHCQHDKITPDVPIRLSTRLLMTSSAGILRTSLVDEATVATTLYIAFAVWFGSVLFGPGPRVRP